MILTIVTPTYNRCRELKNLWMSLQKQTSKAFEWLVVDDGSTDETESCVERFRSSSDFPIRYLYKENGGKHTALNVGINTVRSALTFIVDSDDYLTEDAVRSILKLHEKYQNQPDLCGYVFLRCFPDGRINGKKFRTDEEVASYIDVRINGEHMDDDKAEVFRTHCLKEFPFPEYPGEKFLGEDLIWLRMSRKYKMVHVNQAIYVGNYLENGLTNNRRRHNIASPVGCMHRAEEFLKTDLNMRYRLKGALQYIIYGKFAGCSIRDLIKKTDYRGLVTVCALPGLLIYRKWKKTIPIDA